MRTTRYKEMNNRYPTLDIQHQTNSEYESSTLEAETCWSRDAIDRWMEGCADLVAENVKKTSWAKPPQKLVRGSLALDLWKPEQSKG